MPLLIGHLGRQEVAVTQLACLGAQGDAEGAVLVGDAVVGLVAVYGEGAKRGAGGVLGGVAGGDHRVLEEAALFLG